MARGYPDWEGGKSGLYGTRDWAAVEDDDLSLVASANIAGGATVNVIDHTVPVGDVAYVDGAVLSVEFEGRFKLIIGGITVFAILLEYTEGFTGGRMGGRLSHVFSTPKKAIAGEHIVVELENLVAAVSIFTASLDCREFTL